MIEHFFVPECYTIPPKVPINAVTVQVVPVPKLPVTLPLRDAFDRSVAFVKACCVLDPAFSQ